MLENGTHLEERTPSEKPRRDTSAKQRRKNLSAEKISAKQEGAGRNEDTNKSVVVGRTRAARVQSGSAREMLPADLSFVASNLDASITINRDFGPPVNFTPER